MNSIKVIESRCTGCGACVGACPVNCISLKDSGIPADALTAQKRKKIAVIDPYSCIYCGACVDACGELAVQMTAEKPDVPADDITAYKGVWCFAEVMRGKLSPTAFELLNIGRALANDLGEPLSAVLMGKDVSSFAEELIERGADTVYVCDDPFLENFLDETYARVLAGFIREKKPNKFILPATTMGRSLSSRVAIIVNTGLTADATGLVIDKTTGLMQVTRPTFGGNLMATIVCGKKRPEMCSLRPLAYPKAGRIAGGRGEVVTFSFEHEKCKSLARFAGFVPEEAGELDIGGAEIIVSGGRGLNKPEGFELIRELAHVLGGAVGSSRAAVDSGWIPYRHQVGLTGKTVRPKLYIACGISGQIQHMAGMSSSDVIVAINKDPDAPLMKSATFSIEGNLYEIIPALIEEIKKRKMLK